MGGLSQRRWIKIKTAFYVFVSMVYMSYFPNKCPISCGSVFNVLLWGPEHEEDPLVLSLLLCPPSQLFQFLHFCLKFVYSLVYHFFSILLIVHVLCTTHPPSLPPYLSKSFTIYLSVMQVWRLESCAMLEEMLHDIKQAIYPNIISCSYSILYHRCLYYDCC